MQLEVEEVAPDSLLAAIDGTSGEAGTINATIDGEEDEFDNDNNSNNNNLMSIDITCTDNKYQ